MRLVTRSHVIAWRDNRKARDLAGTTIRSKLAAISSLFEYLCECNAITHNPVKGGKRPKKISNKGSTPAISIEQARELLASPNARTLKGKRDKAILATLLYRGLRREELCRLRVKDMQMDEGVLFLLYRVKATRSVEYRSTQ